MMPFSAQCMIMSFWVNDIQILNGLDQQVLLTLSRIWTKVPAQLRLS
jgi:hypothetical protein